LPGELRMSKESSQEPSRYRERSIRKLLRPPVPAKPATEGSASCDVFYTGKSSYGPVGFSASFQVESSENVEVSDALHGLVLGVIELKIQFIESWLQSEMDIAPGLRESEVNSELFTIKEEENGSEMTLHLPVQYWHLIPQFPSKYFPSNWSLDWTPYKGNMTLSKLSMELREAEKIAKGSLVLIPESFGENWEASLTIPELSISIPGHYEASVSNWTVSGGFDVIPSDSVVKLAGNVSSNEESVEPSELDEDIRGVITYPLDVPSKTLIPSINQQTLLGNMTTTHRECRLALSNGKIHKGYIAPVATGYGLFVTSTSVL